jgi:hypothetical protein
MYPEKLDRQIEGVYGKAIPFLGVNSKIKRKWRTLPNIYQGNGLPNLPLAVLAENVLFLCSNWGFHGQAQSNPLTMAYDNFPVEVGLYSSPLQWNYAEFGHLATDATWFQNLWHLVILLMWRWYFVKRIWYMGIGRMTHL